MKATLLALTLLALAPTRVASIIATNGNKDITVHMERGADGACTVFREQRETEHDSYFPDGHYAPRHCWSFEDPTDDMSYEDDWRMIKPYGGLWDVWAEVSYPDGTQAVTNTLVIKY